MKKFIFFIILLAVYSCKKEDTKTLAVPSKSVLTTNTIIYSSKSLKPYLKFNEEFSEYELIKLDNPQLFTDADLNYPVKENEFEFNKTADFKYYTPFTFEFSNVSYKLIAYHSYGENDSKVTNIQLNSYRGKQQIDALLLDCRFIFETEYYSEFTIAKDGTIAIKKIAINGLNYDQKGNIVGEKKVKDSTTETVRYKMNKGTFTQL
jgi:hypothetical protein